MCDVYSVQCAVCDVYSVQCVMCTVCSVQCLGCASTCCIPRIFVNSLKSCTINLIKENVKVQHARSCSEDVSKDNTNIGDDNGKIPLKYIDCKAKIQNITYHFSSSLN